MTDIRGFPAYAELCQLIAELSLVSHAPAGAYGRQVPDSTDSKGGRRPPGGSVDRPQRPRKDASERDWEAYEEERTAWLSSYQRRTPEYFRRELGRCVSEYRLGVLRDEARETLDAWRRTPVPVGQPPERGAPTWKRWVAESDLDAGKLAAQFGVTRQYIYMIRRAYRTVA